ncbi:hypothetical protein AB8615_10560 [Litorimonas sp. RW-G-Af-16]|uniref:hypothetical protein n=1 Tax=Litorimonas sp. RW-G-Af-16 TaxID=3241168 RepID=UPI003AAFF820
MTTLAVEMTIEPGAERLVTDMGRRMKTKARSKVIDRTLTQIRDDFHISELTDWFREDAFAVQRRTTVRLSPENADFVAAPCSNRGQGEAERIDGAYLFCGGAFIP